ncbi:hypothetical protein [Erwinia amylovora]|uniref:hypothetical protein n=1 Tax=Erwinia amylovora TaxID=552 RepID=UPI003D004D47
MSEGIILPVMETNPPGLWYTAITNPRYEADNRISCFVAFTDGVTAPFTCGPNDNMDYAKDIYARAVAGDFGTVTPYVPPMVAPISRTLSPDQFYTLIDSLGKLDQFIAAIENVTPTAKKLTCRNQFNNSTSFTWDMVLMAHVAPKVWGEAWQDNLATAWVAASA